MDFSNLKNVLSAIQQGLDGIEVKGQSARNLVGVMQMAQFAAQEVEKLELADAERKAEE